MVYVSNRMFFLAILLFALASTGVTINTDTVDHNGTGNISNIDSTDTVSSSESEDLLDIPIKAVLGEVVKDPLCAEDDLGTDVVLIEMEVWDEITEHASDCSKFDLKIKCKPSELGGCKTEEYITVYVVGPNPVLPDVRPPMIFTFAFDPFKMIAVDGATQIMIEIEGATEIMIKIEV